MRRLVLRFVLEQPGLALGTCDLRSETKGIALLLIVWMPTHHLFTPFRLCIEQALQNMITIIGAIKTYGVMPHEVLYVHPMHWLCICYCAHVCTACTCTLSTMHHLRKPKTHTVTALQAC